MARRNGKPSEHDLIRDRIVELRRVRAADLVPSPNNWRTHSRQQKKAMQGILKEIGYADCALAREDVDGRLRLIDGHLRQSLDPEQMIPTLILDLNQEEADKLMVSLDPLASLAGTDADKLKDLLDGIATEDEGLQAMFDDMAAKAGLDRLGEGDNDPEPDLNRAEELAAIWGVEEKQVWEIPGKAGCHRVMCGDSTSKDDVEKLLDGEKPFLMVTDPPYGVSYEADWRPKSAKSGGVGSATAKYATARVANDDRASWSAAYALFPGGVAYVWHAGIFADVVARGLQAAGFAMRAQIIWLKRKIVVGRGNYHWQHEPCWYAVRKGQSARFCGNHKNKTVWGDIIDQHNTTPQDTLYAARIDDDTIYAFGADKTTVWEISQDKMVEGGHSTQKPLECMARPIRNHGKKGDGVYDPFGGTGTTLIAAENLGRVAFLMEIDPGYTGVILQRAKAFGLEPRLAE